MPLEWFDQLFCFIRVDENIVFIFSAIVGDDWSFHATLEVTFYKTCFNLAICLKQNCTQ